MADPRPDLLAALPGLIAERVRLVMPHLRDCRGVAGRYDAQTLKRKGVAAPAVLVSMLGLRTGQQFAGPHVSFDADFAAFVVTKDEANLRRDEAAANMVQALLELIPNNGWGQVGVAPATDVRGQPLITEATDGLALALWAVTWTHQIAFRGWPVTQPLPISVYLGQAPDIGAGNEAAYEEIGGGE
jgi:hypothetical protein